MEGWLRQGEIKTALIEGELKGKAESLSFLHHIRSKSWSARNLKNGRNDQLGNSYPHAGHQSFRAYIRSHSSHGVWSAFYTFSVRSTDVNRWNRIYGYESHGVNPVAIHPILKTNPRSLSSRSVYHGCILNYGTRLKSPP